MRLAFAGTPEFSVPALRAVLDAGHEVVGVLTQPDRPAGRGRTLTASPVKQFALERGIAVAQPPRLATAEQRAPLVDWAPAALVVVAYGLLLPPAVLALPEFGCINIHASLLPRWRGAAPIQRALLAGDAETGVCIMQMDAGLDTGPVLRSSRLAIAADDTSATLQARLAALGATLLCETLPLVETRRLTPHAQPTEGITYAAKLQKSEARIDWRQSAVQIERQVRAFNPWPVADTLFRGAQLRIWEAQAIAAGAAAAPGTVLGQHADALQVACGTGVLAIRSLQPAGRRVQRAAEFAHAHELVGLGFG
ncbi:MAG TPA: methionyl-tRNA formyltransferase [Steroidobacteraceae bacterium]|nr:methionyl-tRNA formyltransferase [Steroidobacteraceae bacterium]